jgi:hypothetical protein
MATFTASGGTGTYTWTLADTLLPKGLVFDPAAARVIGKPMVAGRYPLSVTATDSEGRATTLQATVVVASKMAVTPLRLHSANVGTRYSAALQTTGGVGPSRWTLVSGKLPRGLHFERRRGVLIGTPRVAGRFRMILEVRDAFGVKSRGTFVLVVNA